MRSFNRASTHLESRMTLSAIDCSLTSWWTWRMPINLTNFHSWRECVFQENTSLAIILILVILSLILSLLCHLCTRWNWMMFILKMVRRYSFSLWMLLGTSSSRIEKVVNTLKCSSSLTRNFATAVLLDWVLKLNIWKSGKHLAIGIDTLI